MHEARIAAVLSYWVGSVEFMVQNNDAGTLQARAKALREQQRSKLDSRHKYILSLVAERLQLEASVVEDFMLDGEQVRAVSHQLRAPQ